MRKCYFNMYMYTNQVTFSLLFRALDFPYPETAVYKRQLIYRLLGSPKCLFVYNLGWKLCDGLSSPLHFNHCLSYLSY